MRRLWRPVVRLPTLTDGAGARKAQQHESSWQAHSATSFDFPAHWNEPDVRGALYAMHGRVCAFCLSKLTRGDRGDVEHFRPKKFYWWLAYAFTNYVLSCSRCNRVFKREEFPLSPGTLRLGYENRESLDDEQRLLLDPVADPVEEWLSLDRDDPLFLWKEAPSLQEGSLEQHRVLETQRMFHWNDDPDLLKERFEAIDEALFALEQGDTNKARRLASRFCPHGETVRRLFASLRAVKPPTPEEELEWLLEDFWQEWEWARKLPESELSKKKQEELLWTFAVLWKAPPTGNAAAVEAWLTRIGLKAHVEGKYRYL